MRGELHLRGLSVSKFHNSRSLVYEVADAVSDILRMKSLRCSRNCPKASGTGMKGAYHEVTIEAWSILAGITKSCQGVMKWLKGFRQRSERQVCLRSFTITPKTSMLLCWQDFSPILFFLKKDKDFASTKGYIVSVQFSSVTQSCWTLCDPMNLSTPGLPVHHQLPEFPQTHAHRVGDAIQPSHPLSSPSPPAPNPSEHQGLFQWVNSSHEVAKVLYKEMQISESRVSQSPNPLNTETL